MAMVCERELGIALDKNEQTSDWAQRPLSDEQLRYAALDAEVLLALAVRLPLDVVEQRRTTQGTEETGRQGVKSPAMP